MTNKQPKERPQAEQSRQLLSQALLTLMKQERYQEITIAKLTTQAGVSRRTFYRHFDTLPDLLAYILDDFVTGFKSYFMDNAQENDFYSILMAYFSYCETHKSLIDLLYKQQLGFLFTEQVMPAIRNAIHKTSGTPHTQTNYVFYFAAGGAAYLLYKWVENDMKQSPEEMTELTLKSIKFFAQQI
ncbi:TetR/AcrR family transcriptional regulator [Ligilactobacillus acidipiscis]|uniref:TetR/AcrR family transcriptional regulator n=1 Tax=Ligilactobacillus acidipiscis TaxID=89059 RepID=UPI0023F80BA8|nr:TetR/AcrR family transcriptional regulator [Ligilactobacillus acidipiscis]WEV57432.1 TetR/AcrR family transcriptional regulator [Ligilactobacillus acidipiscis]